MPTFDDYDPEDYSHGDGKRLPKQGRRLLKLNRAESFRCAHCGFDVPMDVPGSTQRNHCPICLWSRHVDEEIGDRASTCLASMEPIGLTLKSDGVEVMVIHRCCACDKLSKNRLAGDDNPVTIEKIHAAGVALSDSEKQHLAQAGMKVAENLPL